MKIMFIDQIAKVNYKYSFNLCNELKKAGFDIELVIDNKEDLNESNVLCHCLFNTADKNINKISKGINYFFSWKKIYKMVLNKKVDVIHVQWFILSPIDYIFLYLMKKKDIKIIITIHDILPFNEKFYDYIFHKKIYSIADEVILQTEPNIKRFQELFPTINKKLNYIPHGNFVNYAKVHNKNEARNYLGIPCEKKVILFFGQIKQVKGLGVLIDAFNQACKERNDLFLIIAGSIWNDDFSHYQQKIDDYSLAEKIKCDIKYIKDEEVGYYYSACDINILPYLDVYQSGVIQLSYAHRKPVIATDIDGFKNIVYDNINGYLVNPNDIDDLASCIIKAFDNYEKLSSLGEKGYEIIKEKFSWEDIADKVINLYQNN